MCSNDMLSKIIKFIKKVLFCKRIKRKLNKLSLTYQKTLDLFVLIK